MQFCFIPGRKVNDRGHPDYVPSVFSRNQGRSTEVRSTGAKLDRFKRRQKRDELPGMFYCDNINNKNVT